MPPRLAPGSGVILKNKRTFDTKQNQEVAHEESIFRTGGSGSDHGVRTVLMGPGSDYQDHVAALKQSLAQSQGLLKQYEWIETMVVSVKGEEKSMKPRTAATMGRTERYRRSRRRGLHRKRRRGGCAKVAESKKEEMTEYMQSAVRAGEVLRPAATLPASRRQRKPGKCPSRLPDLVCGSTVRDYEKPGDTLQRGVRRQERTPCSG